MALEVEEIQNASLAELGVILIDSVDQAVADEEYEEIEAAYQSIGQEIIRRIPDTTKIRPMMDFHYKKWADLQVKGTNGSRSQETELNNSYLEFRAMMAGFVEAASKDETDS